MGRRVLFCRRHGRGGGSMNAVEAAKEVVLKEASALSAVAGQIGEAFERMADAMRSCTGKVVIIGMGKSGHVANKMAATLSSLGTCSISLHPGECMHGDLGMIQKQDAVILISYSGESDEIVRIIPGLKIIGAKLMGITCNAQSTLARSCEVVQVLDGIEEACHLGLAPTTSTTAVMAYGDALAVAISRLDGFSKNDFGVFHPAGSLGKRLTIRATDLMRPIRPETLIAPDASVADAIIAISESDADILLATDAEGCLAGILTNGDLKRAISRGCDIREEAVEGMVNRFPCFADASSMAVDVLRMATERGVGTVPVVKDDIPVGILSREDILREGIYL